MLKLQEVQNMRAFLLRVSDLKGSESIAHALCLQALQTEEAAIVAASRKAAIEKLSADGVKQPPKEDTMAEVTNEAARNTA